MPALPKQDGEFFYVLQGALKIIYVDDDPILREFANGQPGQRSDLG